jgi:hypothetical protein
MWWGKTVSLNLRETTSLSSKREMIVIPSIPPHLHHDKHCRITQCNTDTSLISFPPSPSSLVFSQPVRTSQCPSLDYPVNLVPKGGKESKGRSQDSVLWDIGRETHKRGN